MILMKESPYEIGTDEVAAKLGLSPRSVRRLGEKNILEGRVEITSTGKQWFFSRESVGSLIKIYEAKREKEERHRTAKDAFTGVPGQPRMTEDTTEASRPPLLSDEKRVEFLQGLLEQERKEHTETKEKLENKSAQLLEKVEVAARLEGEKMGFEKYVERLEIQQKQLMAMLQNTLQLKQPRAEDNNGHETEDNRRRPRPAEVTSEVVSEQKLESEVGGVAKVVSHTTPPQSPQNEQGEDFTSDEVVSPPSMSKSHTEENFGAGEGTPPPQDYGEDGEVINITSV